MPKDTRPAKVPLSQMPGKKKLMVAIPGALAAGAAWKMGIDEPVTGFVTWALCAYAVVGLLEVVFGESLAGAARKWDRLAGWKKFLFSVLVIVAALVGFVSLIPVFARWVQ